MANVAVPVAVTVAANVAVAAISTAALPVAAEKWSVIVSFLAVAVVVLVVVGIRVFEMDTKLVDTVLPLLRTPLDTYNLIHESLYMHETVDVAAEYTVDKKH
jgi:hypothetical protein